GRAEGRLRARRRHAVLGQRRQRDVVPAAADPRHQRSDVPGDRRRHAGPHGGGDAGGRRPDGPHQQAGPRTPRSPTALIVVVAPITTKECRGGAHHDKTTAPASLPGALYEQGFYARTWGTGYMPDGYRPHGRSGTAGRSRWLISSGPTTWPRRTGSRSGGTGSPPRSFRWSARR